MKSYDLKVKYHPDQFDLFHTSQARNKIAVKGRRFGLTRGAANYYCEKMVEGVSPLLWVDTAHGNIDRYVERYFMPVLHQLPSNKWNWRQQKKELNIMGARADFRSADRSERFEGFAYKNIFLNEAGIILKDEYLYYNSIVPMMLDHNPDVIIGGTPKGKGLFHRLANKAIKEDGDNPDPKKRQYFHFTSFDNPFLREDEIDELTADMPELVRKQEIYAEFLDDATSVFRNVRVCATAEPTEPRFQGVYFLGADLARLVDFTVIIVMDSEGRQVYQDRFNQIDWNIQKERIRNVSIKYNNAQVIVDATGVGDPIFEDLRRAGLNVTGYKFTNESKKALVHALMLAFEQEEIRILDDKVLINELEVFEFNVTPAGYIRYSAPEGLHDDCVYALALANWGRKQGGGGAFAWSKDDWR